MQGTWKATSGGGGGGGVLAAVVAVVVAAAVAIPVITAATHLLVALAQLVLAVVLLVVVALVAFLVVSARRNRGRVPAPPQRPAMTARQVPWERPVGTVPGHAGRVSPPELAGPQGHALHVHLDGLSPEAAEAAIRALREGDH